MPRRKPRPPYQRARSESQKSERRRAILDAADARLRRVGLEAFSMGALAKHVGIAKGTLYLYFETREELLLCLYAEQLAAWSEALLAAVHPGMADDAFVRCFLETTGRDATFLDVSAKLGSVIEHNVSLARLIESKRTMRDAFTRLGERLGPCLALPPEAAVEAVVGLGALLIGAAQLDAGPSLDGEDVPADVQQVMALFAHDDVFSAHAPALLAGIRARALPPIQQRRSV
jgi:AcrR family transcriptional regulator